MRFIKMPIEKNLNPITSLGLMVEDVLLQHS